MIHICNRVKIKQISVNLISIFSFYSVLHTSGKSIQTGCEMYGNRKSSGQKQQATLKTVWEGEDVNGLVAEVKQDLSDLEGNCNRSLAAYTGAVQAQACKSKLLRFIFFQDYWLYFGGC